MTVLEAIQRSTEFLARKGVESPRLHTELLLASVLRLPRMRLYLEFERHLSESEADALRQRVVRRGQREPLQHILGSTSFCGIEISVDRSVLIPRPETELLAAAAWEFLGRRGPEAVALDLGTGSGCLAIALAVKCPGPRILAVDISEAALATARANASSAGVGARIEFLRGDWFAPLPVETHFDLIVSNPPYIPSADIASLEPEVKAHDPRLALDGGADGLYGYRRLATEAATWLKPNGRLMLEFGDGQAEPLRDLLETAGWTLDALHEDYSHRPRFLVARRAQP